MNSLWRMPQMFAIFLLLLKIEYPVYHQGAEFAIFPNILHPSTHFWNSAHWVQNHSAIIFKCIYFSFWILNFHVVTIAQWFKCYYSRKTNCNIHNIFSKTWPHFLTRDVHVQIIRRVITHHTIHFCSTV